MCLCFACAARARSHYVATGSDDHTILLWDLRKRSTFYSIPAHTHLISNVRFQVQCSAKGSTPCFVIPVGLS